MRTRVPDFHYLEGLSMNFKQARIAFILTGLGALAGCSSPSMIKKTDGSHVITADRPKYDEDSGMYVYYQDGRKVQVNKSDVKSIEELE